MIKEEIISKFPFVEVEWIDAESDASWENMDAVNKWSEKDCIVYESGYIVKENKKYIVISNQFTDDHCVGNRTKIPKKWIKSITYGEFKPVKKNAKNKLGRNK